MNLHRCVILALLGLGAGTLSLVAEDKSKFADHPFFKHLVGSWKSEGDLKGTDGKPIKITQEWMCKVSDEGGVVIEGSRSVNDGALLQKYRWNITHNPTTDLYEAVQMDAESQQNSIRFEGTFGGTTATLELKAEMANGGTATITDSFTGEGHDTFESKILVTNVKGDTTLEGTLKSERVK
jgi:hypothetical protein